MSRKKYNVMILTQLEILVEKYPDLRFCQLLSFLELDQDLFYEESSLTYKKLNVILNQEKKGE